MTDKLEAECCLLKTTSFNFKSPVIRKRKTLLLSKKLYFTQNITIQKTSLSRITLNPAILFGKPSIRNTRYSVELILDLLSAGMTNAEIIEAYPDLEVEDLQACLLFVKI